MDNSDINTTPTEPDLDPTAVPDIALEEPEAKAEFDHLADAFRSGAEKAKKTAKRVGPKIRSGFGDLAYRLAYGTSFGVNFGATVARELVPEKMKEGAAEGADAGKQAATKMMTPGETKEEETASDDPVPYPVT